MKAVGLLRAWLKRLDALGVKYLPKHRWLGWQGEKLLFAMPDGTMTVASEAALLALGGASWPRFGSDGAWTSILSAEGIEIAPLAPANCGFVVPWSDHFASRFAGTPLKPVAITHGDITRQGEAVVTTKGLEGGVIYALSREIRNAIEVDGKATVQIDLRPGMTHAALTQKLTRARGAQSFSTYLRSCGFPPLASALLRELMPPGALADTTPDKLASWLKELPLTFTATSGLARAISSAGGIAQSELTDCFMLKKLPGIFAAGEMLNWEAPTGGYLLQACFSTAVAAAERMNHYLTRQHSRPWTKMTNVIKV